MKKLELYIIDADYIKYLYSFDSKVMYWESVNYKSDRKYLGVVLNINGFNYFAPLSSPKENDYYYKSGKKLIRKNAIPIVRLITDKGQLLGKIKLSNMIPVKESHITLYDVEGEKDKKYQDLVYDELICIRKCKNEIIKNAHVLYKQKLTGYSDIKYLEHTVDFKLLESACEAYESVNAT